MMKKFLTLLLALGMSLGAVGCQFLPTQNSSTNGGNSSTNSSSTNNNSSSSSAPIVEQDYVANTKLDLDSTDTKKMEVVSVHAYIDGDTTHFEVPAGFNNRNILKARYLAVNTPESTGQIEPWGKKASNFTKTTLQSAESIVLETDGAEWEADSTGDRYLVWVWYRKKGETEYRNLNLELLQEGLGAGSKASNTRYGTACAQAINQAKNLRVNYWSKEQDPDFYYGAAIEMDLKELRTNFIDNGQKSPYNGMRVAFEGYVSYYSSQGVYIENYDEATNMWYGMYAYYGFNPSSQIPEILKVGNYVRVVGKFSYWETGGAWQVSDLKYDAFNKKHPDNVQRLDDKKYDTANVETSLDKFFSKVNVVSETTNGDGETVTTTKAYNYADLAMNTSLSVKNLRVTRAYTTNNGGDNDGAMTLTCTDGNKTITVRTVVLKDANGNLITQDMLLNKTIDVIGIVDTHNGEAQIKVFNWKNITVH